MTLDVRQAGPPVAPKPRHRRSVSSPDPAFPWFIGAALVFAAGGGFLLAVLLPLAAALDWGWGPRWRALVQAHGHLQLAGWLGLFITGMAFRLAPRFAGRPLRFYRVTTPALILLAFGLLGRAVAQPWLATPGMRVVLLAAGAAEVGGALLALTSLALTLAPVVTSLTQAPLFLLGTAGFVTQAALTFRWLAGLTAADPIIPPARDRTLLDIQFFLFVLPFVCAILWRALPTFVGAPSPGVRRAWLQAALLLTGGLLLASGPQWWSGATAARLHGTGAAIIAVAIVIELAGTAIWRPADRLRPVARHVVLLIRTACLWLVATAVWLAYDAAWELRHGLPVNAADGDGIRHILALGVFTTLIFGMGQLMLPWLAMRRQSPSNAAVETRIIWALITGATVLRVAGALMERQGSGQDRYWPMATAGVLGITALTFFGVTVLRAAHRDRQVIPVGLNEGGPPPRAGGGAGVVPLSPPSVPRGSEAAGERPPGPPRP